MKRLLSFLFLFGFTAAFADEFKLPSDQETLAVLKTAFAGKTEHSTRAVRRLGNKTLEVECLVAMHGDFTLFKKISSDYADWRNWVLVDINTPQPGQSDYLLQLHDLNYKSDKKMVSAKFNFNIPFFSKRRGRSFKVSTKGDAKSFTLTGETILNENSAVKMANGYMKAFPAEGKPGIIWISVKSIVIFSNGFFYEALPEKIVLREVGERLQYLVQNYQKEEQRRKESPHVLRAAVAPEVKVDPAEDL